MHNHSAGSLSFSAHPATDPSRPVIRPATGKDADQIWGLVTSYAAEGLMLPRTLEQVAMRIDSYVVASVGSRIVACAALEEYSPSLAEVSSVAVAKSEHGNGLGTQVVLGVERLARARDVGELFALSLTDTFFLSMDYTPASISRYPEKLARYEALRAEGVEIVPKPCFQKMLGESWQLLQLVADDDANSAVPARRAS